MSDFVLVPRAVVGRLTRPVIASSGDRTSVSTSDLWALADFKEPAGLWVLQRNDFPHAVFFAEAEARAELESKRKAELEWREQNAHVADVRTYWNLYQCNTRGSAEGVAPVIEGDKSREEHPSPASMPQTGGEA